ncbi:MAG: hypothetical protein LUG51_14490 [Tannerellaceae bacterium]|nr:hypothetical protein [Tannerellaceae bacterium]
MKKHLIHLFLLWFSSLSNTQITAQENVFSYQIIFESKLDYQKMDRHTPINPDNYMELKDFASLTQVYPVFSFESRTEQLSFLLQTEGNIRNYNFDTDSTDFSFQELFLQAGIKNKYFLVIGKKRLDWGTGMIWNPTNFYIQKDPLRTQNRLEGIYMIHFTWLIQNNALQCYIFPDKKGKDFSYALKYEIAGNRLDGSISYLRYKTKDQIGVDFSYGGDKFTIYGEGVARNFSKSYKVSDSGILIPPKLSDKIFHMEWLTGGSLLLTNNFTFRGEYRFRGDYLNKKDIQNFINYLPGNIILYDALTVSKHSLFGSLEYLDTYDRGSVSLRTFYDPVSGQHVLSPLGVWKKNNLQIELSAMFFNNKLPVYNLQTTLLISYYF